MLPQAQLGRRFVMAVTRIALVSGGNRGIGLEIARQLARKGVKAVIGSRELERGHAAVQSIVDEGHAVEVVQLDTTDESSIAAAVEEIALRHGRIDILVNNAAILIDGPGGFKSSLFELKADTDRQPVVRCGPTFRHAQRLSRLSYFEDGAECSDPDHGRGTRQYEHQGECSLPGLGANRHGRRGGRTARGDRRRDTGLAGDAG
jgi:hypothetical protein